MTKRTEQSTLISPEFEERFFEDYAGRLITDPIVAIVELVANCWDAGATKIEIDWPEKLGGVFRICDDGWGMTHDDFISKWRKFNYNRRKNQGNKVIFPDAQCKIKRTAYGRNGKGRHSLFCFSNEYTVTTWREGKYSIFKIMRTSGESPYTLQFISEGKKEGSGTNIECNIEKNYVKDSEIRDLLGSKFITDPSFKILFNGKIIELIDLKELCVINKTFSLPNEDQMIKIQVYDSQTCSRISKNHGVAWWVNNRLVGQHSWKGFEGTYLDGRYSVAKRYTVIVQTNLLDNEVEPDWTGFLDTPRAKRIITQVNQLILETVQELTKDVRKTKKVSVLEANKDAIDKLSSLSKERIGKFIDLLLMKCPSLSIEATEKTVEILAQLESSRKGYTLIKQLAKCSTSELDDLSDILEEWSIPEAKIVLEVLQSRLDLIKELERLVEDTSSDELHMLQPLFARGLWIFGPQFEAVEFTSNQALVTVMKKFFNIEKVKKGRLRPDFVILPDSSLGIYSHAAYDDHGMVRGIQTILIIELKRGGFTITAEEKYQAQKYAKEMIKSGQLLSETEIICFVLGSSVELTDQEPVKEGNIIVHPRPYSTILQNAHARTFNLIQKIQKEKNITMDDEEIKQIFPSAKVEDFPNKSK